MVERFTPMPQLDRASVDVWAGGCWLSTEDREVVGSTPATPTDDFRFWIVDFM